MHLEALLDFLFAATAETSVHYDNPAWALTLFAKIKIKKDSTVESALQRG